MKTRKNSITTNYIYNMIFQVLNLLLPFITTPYVSRVLKADNIGIYSYTYSIITTFVLVGSLGVATYGQKEIAAVGEDKQKRSQLFWEIACVKTIAITLQCNFPILSVQYWIFLGFIKELKISSMLQYVEALLKSLAQCLFLCLSEHTMT